METSSAVKFIADFFLISVANCLILFSPLASSKLTGNGFIKLISNVSIGALVLSLVIFFNSTFTSTSLFLRVLALLALILTTVFHRDDKRIPEWFLYFLIITPLTYELLLMVRFVAIDSLFLISSTFLLGLITYSMILGHWYLVVPKLSEAPLKKAAIMLWFILAIKIFWSLLETYSAYSFFEEQTQLGAGYAFNWLLLSMRFSFGYLVILGMSFFNWKLLKLRSIQSSTGVLYAMTFFVFIGELVSMFMFINYGLKI